MTTTHLTCHQCGQDHDPISLRPGEKALCCRCDTLLARGTRFGTDAPLAFAVTGLILAIPAMSLPFLGAEKLGDARTSLLLTGVAALWRHDMVSLSILVLFLGAILPVALLVTLIALHLPTRLGREVRAEAALTRVADFFRQWSIPEVQVLATLVALAKLGSLVTVSIGAGFWCYCAMTLAMLIAQHGFAFGAEDPSESDTHGARVQAAAARNSQEGFARSRSMCLALGLTAAVMLIPANLLPVLETETTGRDRVDTIYSGVKELAHQGLWPLAAIVFTASIVIPVLKLIGLTWLLVQAHRGPQRDSRRATKIYAAVNFIGRWSMLDVFLAALLLGLVQFGELATVIPRAGLIAFAAAVVLTVLATESFDPRQLWNNPATSQTP
jgi:paraquat-inducible protein A